MLRFTAERALFFFSARGPWLCCGAVVFDCYLDGLTLTVGPSSCHGSFRSADERLRWLLGAVSFDAGFFFTMSACMSSVVGAWRRHYLYSQ